MKKITNDFRNSVRGIKELSLDVSFMNNELHEILECEDGNKLLADNNEQLWTESALDNLDENRAVNLSVNSYANLGKTICKYIELESTTEMPKKKYPNAKIGIKVINDYEFLNYGNYEVTECKYQFDKKRYSIVAYDKMIKSMIKYDDNPLKISYPITHRALVVAICNFLGFKYDLPTVYPNSDKIITKDIYAGNNMTYRDILDDLNTVIGACCFTFTVDDIFTIKFIGNSSRNSTLLPFTVDTDTIINKDLGLNIQENVNVVNDYDLKTDNVDMSISVGPINQVVYTDKDNVSWILGQDDKSIELNGLHTYEITDCKLLDSNLDTFGKELFNTLNGLKYQVYDLQTKGILNLELLDRFYVNHDNKYYDCVLFNNSINVSNGLLEQLYTDELEEQQQEYTTSEPTSKAVKNAVIQANKKAGTIVLKVTSDNKMAQVRLDANADEGTEFNVSADSIDFQSHTFNLATDDISIVSDNVAITNNGIQLSNGATIAGENGLITNLFYVSGGELSGYQYLGYVGYDGNYQHRNVFLDAYIPKDFTILHAYLTMQHCTVDWYSGTDMATKGKASNIKIYNCEGQYYIDNSFNTALIDDSNLSEIPNALGVNNWSPTSDKMESITAEVDIKNYLKNGMNTLVARVDSNFPSSDIELGQRTGTGKLTLNVIGFVAYER